MVAIASEADEPATARFHSAEGAEWGRDAKHPPSRPLAPRARTTSGSREESFDCIPEGTRTVL